MVRKNISRTSFATSTMRSAAQVYSLMGIGDILSYVETLLSSAHVTNREVLHATVSYGIYETSSRIMNM